MVLATENTLGQLEPRVAQVASITWIRREDEWIRGTKLSLMDVWRGLGKGSDVVSALSKLKV